MMLRVEFQTGISRLQGGMAGEKGGNRLLKFSFPSAVAAAAPLDLFFFFCFCIFALSFHDEQAIHSGTRDRKCGRHTGGIFTLTQFHSSDNMELV
jgi:hypothetical protein